MSGREFLRVDGARLVLDGEEVRLRGVMPTFDPASANERDYAEIAALGLNAATLPLSARDFYASEAPRDYQPRAWEWIDAHLALARRHRLFLTIQLLGVEGAQFVPDKDAPYDFRIWEDARIQENTIALWRAIAARYADDPVVAGYSLFPEPVCAGTVEQWRELAATLAAAIREVDEKHALFVDRVYGEHGARREATGTELPPERAFHRLDDDNVVYEFYFFERDEYTHQFAPWRPEPELEQERVYPDPATLIEYHEGGKAPRQFAFDLEYLRFHLDRQLAFREVHGVPMCVWGFGLNRACSEAGRGGLDWLRDVIGLFEEAELGWTLLTYRDEFFGVADSPGAKALLAGVRG